MDEPTDYPASSTDDGLVELKPAPRWARVTFHGFAADGRSLYVEADDEATPR